MWTERVLPLFVALAAYGVFFKFIGTWEEKLKRWISPERARKMTLAFGRIMIALVHLGSVGIGIVCSTGLLVVILFDGAPLGMVLASVLVGCAAFFVHDVTACLASADQEYEQLLRLGMIFES
jgi:hypothetical protein